MAGSIFWQSGVVQSGALQLSGQGQQLNNGVAVQLSSQDLDNRGVSGGPSFFGQFELLTARSGFASNVPGGSEIEFYLVPSLDGANFPVVDAAGGLLPAGAFRGSFITAASGNANTVASAVRYAIEAVPLMPLLYRPYIKNQTGQALASGWSVFFGTYEDAYT